MNRTVADTLEKALNSLKSELSFFDTQIRLSENSLENLKKSRDEILSKIRDIEEEFV